ncbi:agmatine deiminase family protein [Nocardioides eburneiflavus]|uniref:Agmatine deiminase family protein n=2 Tax=Nocardioides eburneiflavus TaxID=2518372 RepID=A0A4Z1CPV8_9ACTN|nr:agmatine deiminase family protein [Nocardioides eburneiflavus]
MPSETDPHECTWMAWPGGGYTLGDTAHEADVARAMWASVANTIAEYEPLRMLVPPREREKARRLLADDIDVHEVQLDDAWYRDIGPTFVHGRAASGGSGASGGFSPLGAVNWVFNGWGQQDWATWDHDALASGVATDVSGATRIDSPMVNEGGGIHTDGRGTFLVTETVQLDQLRNSGWTKQQVEDELNRTLGARSVIWLPRGLTRDSERFGTKGHVDLLATFDATGRVLVHHQTNAEHPDHAVSQQLFAVLSAATDADGNPMDLVALPAPTVLRDHHGFVDYSYVNHYVANGVVVACAFGDPGDDVSREVLAAAYPGRNVVQLDARPLFERGGGIHCITQQQPAAPAVSPR